MRLRHRELARRATRIGDQSDAGAAAALWVKLHAPEIAGRANSDMDDAIASGGGGRSSNVVTPTESHALQPADPVTRVALAFVNALTEADRLTRHAQIVMENAERAGRWLLAMDAEAARKLAESAEVKADEADETKGVYCANPNCGRYVARTPNDRLRGGRCDACRKYLDRNGIERPQHLCALTEDALGTDALGLDPTRLIVG